MEERRFGRFGRRLIVSGTVATLLLGMLAVTAPVAAKQFAAWGAPSQAGLANVNTTALEGCSMQSPEGLSLYFASDRAGGQGGTDIWVAHRASTSADWGTPENLPDPINSAAGEVCPTPVRGNGLFFASTRSGGCGDFDIYFARLNPHHGWTTPVNLGCQVNSVGPEAGPSYFEAGGHAFLYFSSGPEIMASQQSPNGSWGPAAAVSELNSAVNDFRPNVRKDGLEMVFDSNRSGGSGGQDLWTATRERVSDPWSTPTNLTDLNTGDSEVRASFSWDATTLYFGRTGGQGGSMDLWFTTR